MIVIDFIKEQHELNYLSNILVNLHVYLLTVSERLIIGYKICIVFLFVSQRILKYIFIQPLRSVVSIYLNVN